MPKPEPLLYGQYYHIYNRGNNGKTLFREERNYPYFLKLYAQYIEPVAETFAYCLMPNHFHFLVRIKDWRSFRGPPVLKKQNQKGDENENSKLPTKHVPHIGV